jgi:C-terminal processing protease CtpA/Prc
MGIRPGLTIAGVVLASGLLVATAGIIRPGISAQQSVTPLSPVQVDNLVLLGKVWGFAKYHHPLVTAGRFDWDRELRRVLPSVLSAPDRAAATSAMAGWLTRLGPIDACNPCASMPADVHLLPDLDWIRDERTLGRALSALLVRIHQNRAGARGQHYVGLAPNVGNPLFRNEAAAGPSLPDPHARLIAVYRFWNIIEYWFPYRDLIEEDWDGVLREFVAGVWRANTALAYKRSLMALIARVHDGHANLWSSLDVRPPLGTHRLPVTVRFIENKAVVTRLLNQRAGRPGALRVGDVITRIDGRRIDSLIVAWTPLYAASNQPTRLHDMAHELTSGPAGPARISGERNGRPLEVQVDRVPAPGPEVRARQTHDLPGEAFQMLDGEVAYLKLSAVKAAESADYIKRAANAKVLVIDIRNYPSEFVVFTIGQRLVSARTTFARFTVPNLANPGAFVWTPPIALQPATPRFAGPVVILVDESSQSQAEYTTMAFRAAPNAFVAGSTTAGADGNVSPIMLPGGLRTMISGIGVFYPDKRPTQRVGIVPDLVVRPTIAGVREGRDEVLEAAVSRALGRPFRLMRRVMPE